MVHRNMRVCAYMNICIYAYWHAAMQQGAFFNSGHPFFRYPRGWGGGPVTDPEFFNFPPEGLRPGNFLFFAYIEWYIEKDIENWKTVDNLWITFNWDRTIVGVVGVCLPIFSLSRQFLTALDGLRLSLRYIECRGCRGSRGLYHFYFQFSIFKK